MMSANHTHSHSSSRRLGVAFLLNVSFTLIELVGGYLTNSVAIIADAVHDLGDSISLGLAWGLDKYSKKPSDERFSFGYRRFSLLGALLTAVMLIFGSIAVLSEAVPRLLQPEAADPKGMFLLAVLGVIVNGAAAFRLRGGRSLNERMVSWHLMEDVLGWVAVLIVSVVMYFFDIPILDPILSILITLYILSGVMRNTRKTLDLFLQGVPPEIVLDDLKRSICEVDGVRGAHHLHVWSQDGEHHVMTAHVVVEAQVTPSTANDLRRQIKASLAEQGIEHTTLELEFGEHGVIG